jgi:hypothetical protein
MVVGLRRHSRERDHKRQSATPGTGHLGDASIRAGSSLSVAWWAVPLAAG